MVCKYCNAKVDGRRKLCSECGQPLRGEAEPVLETQELELLQEEAPQAEAPQEEVLQDEVLQEEVLHEEMFQDEASQTEKPKGKVWKLVLMIAGIVVAAAVLAVVLLQQFGVDVFAKLFPEQSVLRKDTYTAEAQKVTEKADIVVAKLGDAELTNATLQIFCREEFSAFLQQYYYYLSQLGLDLTQPLSEQTCYFDETMTWEQFVIDSAISSWRSYVLMGQMADEAGYVLDGEWSTTIEEMPENMQASAEENGFESVEQMLQETYGVSCTLDVYMDYVQLVVKGNAYYSSHFDFTQEQIDAGFTQYEAELAEDGITKTSHLISDVRHILIAPEGGTTSEDGTTVTYSDQEWADCLAKAEQVLDEWKSGEATEESFAALVAQYTADTSSAETGGLYEDVMNDNSYMEAFQNWAIDFSRQSGDTGIVQTDYGYHIMYFVEGEPEWMYHVEQKLYTEQSEALQSQLKERQEEQAMKVSYNKIILDDIYPTEE